MSTAYCPATAPSGMLISINDRCGRGITLLLRMRSTTSPLLRSGSPLTSWQLLLNCLPRARERSRRDTAWQPRGRAREHPVELASRAEVEDMATRSVGLKRPRSAGEESESEEEEDEGSALTCTQRADGVPWNRGACGRQRKVQRLASPNPYLAAFLSLFDDDIIQDFLWVDSCAKLADKYLLSMVYVYFRRASVPVELYTRLNFFIALYLANDIEEDNEDDKYEIFPWALGVNWMTQFPAFLLLRDQLWHSMGFRAVVSKRTCEEVMALAPAHCVWQRSRLAHHGGALRSYLKPTYLPRYGRSSPAHCEHCTSAREGACVLISPLSPDIPPPPAKMDLLDQIDCAFDPALYNTGLAAAAAASRTAATGGGSGSGEVASRPRYNWQSVGGLDVHKV